MPQFQMLPQQPSFGSQLGSQLGSGISQGIGESLGNYFKQKQNARALEGLKPFYLEAGLPEDQFESFKNSGLSASEATPLLKEGISNRQQAAIKQQEQQQKALLEQQKEEKELSGLKSTLKQLREDIGYTGARIPGKSFFGDIPGTEAFGKRKEFDAAGFLAADTVYTHFNKGTISEAKLEVIKNDLSPNSKFSERENLARINALERIMGLPSNTPPEKVDKIIEHEKKRVSDASGSKIQRTLMDIFKS